MLALMAGRNAKETMHIIHDGEVNNSNFRIIMETSFVISGQSTPGPPSHSADPS